MEFRFRAGAGGPRAPSSRLSHSWDSHFTPRASPGHLTGGPPPPPPQVDREAEIRRERIIREEVERRVIEEEVCRELALARARLHCGFGPEPFFGPFMPPPPPPGPFLRVDVPFMPPTRPPPMPAGMHTNRPCPASFGPWQRSGPRRCSGFGQSKLIGEARRMPPPPKPKHMPEPLKVEPDESSAVLSPQTKVPSVKTLVDTNAIDVTCTELPPSSEVNISGVKRKADVIAAANEPTKVQKVAREWSCALCQVRATSEASLNTHLEGKRHKAKLAQCGVIKVTGDYGHDFHATTGNKDSGCSTDAPRKICILVDGVLHEVVQRNNYMWCEHCRVRCENNMTMADHLRGKKHSGLNKVWKSIKALRLDRSKEDSGSAATCMRKVNENCPVEIDVEMRAEITDMAGEVNENRFFETPVGIKKEGSDVATEVNEKNGYVEVLMDFKQGGAVMDVNRNGFIEIPVKDMKEGAYVAVERNGNYISEIPIDLSKESVAADVIPLVPKGE